MSHIETQLYDADGIADAVNFKLTAAIRGPTQTGKGYSCVDEKGCDEEVYFLCARETVGAGIHCLAAMEETSGLFTNAKKKAQACAKAEGVDFDKIEACFNSDRADTLKDAESKYFEGRFPDPLPIPHIEINGQVQDVSHWDYASLLAVLCNTGISAGACSKNIQV